MRYAHDNYSLRHVSTRSDSAQRKTNPKSEMIQSAYFRRQKTVENVYVCQGLGCGA